MKFFSSATLRNLIITCLLVGICDLSCQKVEESPYRTKNSRVVFNKDRALRELAEAAADGKLSTIRELVQKGVPINGQGKEAITPLFWAFRRRNQSGFKELLQLGANPNLYTDDGTSFMVSFAEPLHDQNYENDNVIFLETALKYGGNPNLAADYAKRTDLSPLMAATTLGSSLRRIDLLLDAGAAINYKDSAGNTAIHHAANLNQYYIVWHLIQKGADFGVKNKSGYSLLTMVIKDVYWPPSEEMQQEKPRMREHYAARKKVIKFLRQKGYKFIAYEENPENVKKALEPKIKNYVYPE